MPEITITVNGRNYRITCGPGEETRLQALARGFDQRVESLVRKSGQAGEAQLLVAAGLLLADELDETRAELERLRGAPPAVDHGAETRVAALIDALAQRIEAIAEQLEHP